MKPTPRIVLKPGREKLLARIHPWIFSGAIDHTAGNPQAGDTVEVRDAGGELRGRAAFSPHSQIRARIWSFDAAEAVDEAFFRRRIRSALALRRELVPETKMKSPARRKCGKRPRGFALPLTTSLCVMLASPACRKR